MSSKKEQDKKDDKKPVADKSKKAETKPEPRPPRIHINQFFGGHTDITEVQKAGFKVFVGYKDWLRENEWNEAFKRYFNR